MALSNMNNLIHRWDPNRYYHSCYSGSGSNGKEVVPTLPKSPELGLYHHKQFSIIPRLSGVFFGWGSYLSAENAVSVF